MRNILDLKTDLLNELAGFRNGIGLQDHALDEIREWELCQSHFDSNKGVILPNPYYPKPYLYRGQNRDFGNCRANLYRYFTEPKDFRDFSESEMSYFILNESKCVFFTSLLKNHPAYRWSEKQNLYLNPMDLAQHYGVLTNYLDLTHSVDVACFFASCKYDNGNWYPMDEGEGVLYKFHLHKISNYVSRLGPVGLQTLPRPGEQKAWSYAMGAGEDFAKNQFVEKTSFKHEYKASKEIYDLFSGGDKLFPDDILAAVADEIMNSKKIDKNSLEIVLTHRGYPKDKIGEGFNMFDKLFTKYSNSKIVDNTKIHFDESKLKEVEKRWGTIGKDFYTNVGIRLVRKIK